MKAVRENRLARFHISEHIIREYTPAATVILAGLLPIRAEHNFYAKRVEYVAYGDQFDIVPEGGDAPLYTPTIKDLVGGKYHVSWEKA